jgi:hypothetical protein
MKNVINVGPVLDRVAISASAVCAIHCLSLPLILTVLPTLGATFFGQESFHVVLLWLVIPLSIVALSMGCRKHKNWVVGLLGLVGLTLLFSAAALGHDLLGETGERFATLAGALFIGAGHFRNYSLCRRAACDD